MNGNRQSAMLANIATTGTPITAAAVLIPEAAPIARPRCSGVTTSLMAAMLFGGIMAPLIPVPSRRIIKT